MIFPNLKKLFIYKKDKIRYKKGDWDFKKRIKIFLKSKDKYLFIVKLKIIKIIIKFFY